MCADCNWERYLENLKSAHVELSFRITGVTGIAVCVLDLDYVLKRDISLDPDHVNHITYLRAWITRERCVLPSMQDEADKWIAKAAAKRLMESP